MTLKELKAQCEAEIGGFSGDLEPEFAVRLRELGFREGEKVRCLRTPPLGAPRVYEIGGTVFSIESELTGKINLTEVI